MKKIFWLTCLTLSFTLKIQAQNISLSQPIPMDSTIKTGKLANGLTYFIKKNNLPEKRAELRLVLNAGSMQETDEQQGLAHFVEHMAFNGTKNFKKSELVDFLEMAGVKFGAHLNAYTSFDETVYMLQLPTDKQEIFQKGFQVLEDWAHQVSFDAEEIEKERGVVISERRGRLGANERLRQQWWQTFYEGSRYANRLPIGQLDVLEHFKHETLKDFYQKWYRPDLMAICAVGDFDVNEVEKAIKEKFGAIQNPSNSTQRQSFDVPNHKGLRVAIASDAEATQCNFRITYKQPVNESKLGEDFRKSIVASLFNAMLGNRFDDLIEKGGTPFSFAFSSYSGLVRTKNGFFASAGVKETALLDGLKRLLIENQRVKQYGFKEEEFQRVKISFRSSIEKSYAERDKTKSNSIISGMVSAFLNHNSIPSSEFSYAFYKQYLDKIDLKEVNDLAQQWITKNGDNATCVLTAPLKSGLTLPTEAEIRQVFASIANEKIEPLEDEVAVTSLMKTLPQKGKITAEKKDLILGVTEWTLSNGAVVVFKPTTFKNDEVIFSSYSPGGYAMYPISDDNNGGWASSFIDESGIADINPIALKRFLTGKIFSCSPYIGESSEGLRGSYINKDAETMFQLLHLYFTSPRIDENTCKATLERQKISLLNRNKSPEANFRDSITFALYGNNPRRSPSTVADLDKIKLERALEIYKDRFADASDFSFFFIGNIEENAFKNYIETYVASLPSKGRKEKASDPETPINVRPLTKVVQKGIEPKGQVNLTYFSDYKNSRKNVLEIFALCELLKIKLREKIREEKGGTYGVSVSPQLSDFPKGECRIGIAFECAPERVQELTQTALKEIENMFQNEVEDKNLTKIKETFIRERETSLKENSFWLGYISGTYYNKWNMNDVLSYNERVKALSSKTIKKIAKKHLKKATLMNFTMQPEVLRP